MAKDTTMPELSFGKDENLTVKQPSKWDVLKKHIKEPGDYCTGFKDGAQAAQAAKRLRDTWDIPAKSWTDPKGNIIVGIPVDTDEVF